MTTATKTLCEVLIVSARGILAALTRALAAFEKWVSVQPTSEGKMSP